MMRTWSVTLTEHVEKCAVILKNARKLTDDRPLFRPLLALPNDVAIIVNAKKQKTGMPVSLSNNLRWPIILINVSGVRNVPEFKMPAPI